MIELCPKCSEILRKKYDNSAFYLVCKCGYKKQIKINIKDFSERKNKAFSKNNNKNLIIIHEKDKININTKIKVICAKCGHKEAETWQVQTRSADEPSTHFFRCTKCKFTWREY